MAQILESFRRTASRRVPTSPLDILGALSPGGSARRLRDGWSDPCRTDSPTDGVRPAKPPRLVFLLSAERSGSTLLSMCLGGHPSIIAPPELHLLAYSTFEAWRDGYTEASSSLRYALRACGLSTEDETLDALFRGRPTIDVYRWLLEGPLPRERVLLDKTPKYARSAESLARIEQLEPHYIWLIRHPMAVAASQLELRETRREVRVGNSSFTFMRSMRRVGRRLGARREVEAELSYWCQVNHNIEFFLAGVDPSRWTKVHFEPFIRAPETQLRRLGAWLGCGFDEAMLSPEDHLPAELGPKTGDPKIRGFRGIDPGSADRWKSRIPQSWMDPTTLTMAHHWGL